MVDAEAPRFELRGRRGADSRQVRLRKVLVEAGHLARFDQRAAVVEKAAHRTGVSGAEAGAVRGVQSMPAFGESALAAFLGCEREG